MATSRAPTFERSVELFWAKVRKLDDGCWEWTRSTNESGYGQVSIRALSPAPVLAHRFSFYLAHGRWPEPACLHACDNPLCVRPDHLREGTQAENMADRKARNPRHGARNPAARHAHLVQDIRAAVQNGETQASVARRLGLSSGVVSRIARGVNYGRQGHGHPAVLSEGCP